MPYIQKELRDTIKPRSTVRALTEGQLNYQVSKLCWDYLQQEPLRYARLNEVIGALECAKLELYRRVAAPYEDDAKNRNGEVYE